MNRTFLNSVLSIFTALIIFSCASISPPQGGPKDIEKPKAINMIPANSSINFTEKKIRIRFSEFIMLKDVYAQFIISPHVDPLPEIKEHGKWLQIKFTSKLSDSTTYNMFFGNSIVDITEGNSSDGIQYAFSTGNKIDSAEVQGTVIEAFTKKAMKDVFVMLYKKNQDSIPLIEKPYYLAKTDEKGFFKLKNLKKGFYKIFALKDLNANYLFDQPDEEIAFSKSLVEAIIEKNDSSQINKVEPLKLLLFREKDTTQALLKTSVINSKKITLVFKQSIDSLNMIWANSPDTIKKIIEYNSNKDTIDVWFKNLNEEEAKFKIFNKKIFIDSIGVLMKPKIKALTKGKKTSSQLTFTSNISSSISDYYKPIYLFSNYPIDSVSSNNIILIENKDTIHSQIKFLNASNTKFQLEHTLKEKSSYKLLIKDSVIFDCYGNTNDSILYVFNTNVSSDFGSINLNIKNEEAKNLIIYLIDDKDMIIARKNTNNSKIKFNFIKPGKYFFKIVFDINANNKWDSGSYLQQLFPERTEVMKDAVEVKANWEQEIEWEIK